MEALVLYDSRFGNTRKIAEAIGTALGERCHVQVLSIADAPEIPTGLQLLMVGGPTHRHGLSEGMSAFLDRLSGDTLRGVPAAAFDTRYRGSRLITGSAAVNIARALKRNGARLVAAPESFFMDKDEPPPGEKRRHKLEQLERGELERAREWAARIVAASSVDR